MSDLLTTPELVREVAKEPSKRWRNWWLTHVPATLVCRVCGAKDGVEPGTIYDSHCRTYPSQDAAETHAAEIAEPDEERLYIGAFPEGERP